MEQKDIEYFRTLLNNMLEEAQHKGDSTLEDLTDSERRLIRKIQAAIQRLDEGTYGICEDCGEDISIPRLKARPVTKLCINCKARQEEGENIRGE